MAYRIEIAHPNDVVAGKWKFVETLEDQSDVEHHLTSPLFDDPDGLCVQVRNMDNYRIELGGVYYNHAFVLDHGVIHVWGKAIDVDTILNVATHVIPWLPMMEFLCRRVLESCNHLRDVFPRRPTLLAQRAAVHLSRSYIHQKITKEYLRAEGLREVNFENNIFMQLDLDRDEGVDNAALTGIGYASRYLCELALGEYLNYSDICHSLAIANAYPNIAIEGDSVLQVSLVGPKRELANLLRKEIPFLSIALAIGQRGTPET